VILKSWRKPVYVPNTTGLPGDVLAWFKGRGITPGVLVRNRIGFGDSYMPQVEERRKAILFPFFRGETAANIKHRTLADKMFRMEPGAERVLYGLNDIAERLIWVEGEMDKLSVEVAGFTSCVSVPDGAPTPTTKNYASKFDFLEAPELDKATTHILAVDNDEPGKRLEEELLRRLGRENCLVVHWPDGCKDANDVLVKHGAGRLFDCIKAAEPVPVEGEHAVREFRDSVDRLYLFGTQRGEDTGWYSVNEFYTVMPGEWTLVTGIPGHGKSEWLDALMVNMADSPASWRFAVFSPENQPTEEHLRKLLEKYINKPFSEGPNPRMTQEQVNQGMQFLDDHFTFLLPELPTVESLIERLKIIVKRKGIKGVVLDPWNEIDHTRPLGMSETEHISRCLSKLRAFTRAHGVHLWIVAHPTKLEKDTKGSYPVPTPYDVAGSAHWRNKADNCISIWRDMATRTDTVEVHVQKVRKKAVGQVGLVRLRYSYLTGRYFELSGAFAKAARSA
jgi:twinkle protein